jgi:hypothetical protein
MFFGVSPLILDGAAKSICNDGQPVAYSGDVSEPCAISGSIEIGLHMFKLRVAWVVRKVANKKSLTMPS